MTAKLVKIDKNGSKHYEGMMECPKCGGVGLIVHHMENGQPSYNWTDGGVCWKCPGTGKVLGKWIERTPEYQAKLDAKRKAKQEAKQAELEAKAAEKRQEWLIENGFTPDGFTFLFLGDTYSMKDEIKEAGGKYHGACGWHIDHEVEGFQFLKISKDEMLEPFSYWGYSFKSNIDYKKMKEDAFKQMNNLPDSQFIGEIGQKVEMNVKYIRSANWDVRFSKGYWGTSTQYLHIFEDETGNILTWKTSSPLGEWIDGHWKPCHSGDQVLLKGTIKEHSEYNGQKQTVLTRCKVA